jgi:hypothetical protein
LDVELREQGQPDAENGRNPSGIGIRRMPDEQDGICSVVGRTSQVNCPLCVEKGRLGFLYKNASGVGKLYGPPFGTGEEVESVFFFEVRYLSCKRRLGYVQSVRGPRET